MVTQVIVSPLNDEPFKGSVQHDFDFNSYYVRTEDGELTGPWSDSEITIVCLYPSWEAGMMVVHDEDIESVTTTRPVECSKCGASYQNHYQED